MWVELENNKALVSCEFTEKELVKTIGNYKFLRDRKLWQFPITKLTRIIDSLNIEYNEETKEKYTELKNTESENNKKIHEANLIKANPNPPDNWWHTVPVDLSICFPHQRQSFLIGSMFDSYALFLDMGCGKSLVAIRLIELRKMPTMVVAPLSILESVWLQEIKKWSNLTAVNLWNNLNELDNDYNVYIVNYEHFKKLSKLQKIPPKIQFLIIDESARMKSHNSQITKSILSYANKVKYRLVLSGKPAPNNMLEYWAQMEFIKPELLEGNYFKYRNKFFYSTGYGGYLYLPYSNAKEEIMLRISTRAFFISKKDCLRLPPRTFNIRKVEMDEIQLKKYNEMNQLNILEFQHHTVLGANELAKIMKLRQITAGFAISTEGMPFLISNTKITEFCNVLDEIDDVCQIIVWIQFHYEISMLINLLEKNKISYSTLYGEMSQKSKEESIESFKAGKTRILIAHPKSGGFGLSFTNCNYMIWFSISYSLEEYYQANDRIYRQGQINKCTYIHLLADKSIDEVIYKALQKKEKISDACLQMLKN